MSRPNVTVNGVQVSSGPAPFAVLGDLEVTWGSETIMDEPEPAKARVQFIFRGEADPSWVMIGHRVEIRQRIDSESVNSFSGRVESMSAARRSVTLPNGTRTPVLVITAQCVDYLREFKQTYVTTAWDRETAPGEPARVDRLRGIAAGEGWRLTGIDELPPQPVEHAATHYDSITLYTLLSRYLSWWGPQVTFWDASYADSDGVHTRRIETAWTDATMPGDVLTTTPDGVWTMDYSPPAPLEEHIIPAGAVLADADWAAGSDARLTGARIQYQTSKLETHDDGSQTWQTSLDRSVHTWRPADVLDTYGKRVLELETSAIAPWDEYRRMGRRWLDFAASDWRMNGLTIPRASDLPAAQLRAMFDVRARRRTWWVVDDVDLLTPWGNVATVRGFATGGTLRYDSARDSWSVSMHLTDTRTARPSDLTWDWLQAQPAPFSDAPAALAGDVSFADFQTITTTR